MKGTFFVTKYLLGCISASIRRFFDETLQLALFANNLQKFWLPSVHNERLFIWGTTQFSALSWHLFEVFF